MNKRYTGSHGGGITDFYNSSYTAHSYTAMQYMLACARQLHHCAAQWLTPLAELYLARQRSSTCKCDAA
jgi:hypothetical protein